MRAQIEFETTESAEKILIRTWKDLTNLRETVSLCELDNEIRRRTNNRLRIAYCHTVGQIGDLFFDTFISHLEKQLHSKDTLITTVIATYGGYVMIERNPHYEYPELDAYHKLKMKKEDFEIQSYGLCYHYLIMNGMDGQAQFDLIEDEDED